MRVDIFTIDKLDAAKWNQMAIKGSVFQTYEWAKIAKSRFTEPLFFVAKDENGKWIGGFLIFYFRIKYLSYLANKLIVPSEPIIYEKGREKEIIEILWEEVEKYAKRKNIIYIEWMNLVGSRWKDKEFLLKKGFSKVIKYNSYILDINKPIEELWENLHKKHRNAIRKAEKIGVTIEEENNLDTYYTLSKGTYKRSGLLGPSYKDLKAEWDNLNPKGMCHMFFANHDEKTLAAAFMLFYGDKVLYLHGASSGRTEGASNLLHWEIIKKAKTEGYKWYDFGGVLLDIKETFMTQRTHASIRMQDQDNIFSYQNGKREGIDRFKKRFGGEEHLFYSGYKIYSPIRKKMLEKILMPALHIAAISYHKVKKEPVNSEG